MERMTSHTEQQRPPNSGRPTYCVRVQARGAPYLGFEIESPAASTAGLEFAVVTAVPSATCKLNLVTDTASVSVLSGSVGAGSRVSG